MTLPNILYIHSHDTGRFVSPYGYKVDTPNIQRLAENGMVFRRAFNAAPTCSPSRAALLSGSSPHSCGMLGLTHRGFNIQNEKHLAHVLKKSGYSTHLRGVQHVTNTPKACGYDTVVRHTKSSSVGQGSASALAEELLNSRPREPFFLSVGFVDTHRQYPALEEGDDSRYITPPPNISDAPETRQDWAMFCKSVNRLDQGMGIVFNALEQNGYADNTIIVCTTDHGVASPRMKCNLTDAGTGVMLIMKIPGYQCEGKVCDSLVSHIDVFPTLCDIIGAAHPDWLEGKSLLPLIEGENIEVNDEIFSEVTFHASYEPKRCIRTQRYKYIRRFGDRTSLTRPNIDASLTKSYLLELGFGNHEQAKEQLYDVLLDPQEFRNLVRDSHWKHVLDDMRDRLRSWMERTDDPLLQGDVPLPPGARVTDPNELDPNGRLIINQGE